MSTPEHREVAGILLEKARADLSAARTLAATENQDDHIIGFHLQQAVEKALKSRLAEAGVEIPHTHDLAFVIELVGKAGLAELPTAVASADWLTPWGVLFRYDDPAVSLDRDRALEAATSAVAWAEAGGGEVG